MDWKSRIPKDYVPSGIVEGDIIKVVWTALEQQIMKACQQTKLTEAQRDTLDSDIHILNREMEVQSYKSPNDLYDEEPLYKEFANKKIQLMISNGASAGKLVKALANYTHPHGWLVYQELYTPKEPERSVQERRTTIVGDLPE